MLRDVVFVSGVRTPFGRFQGSLANLSGTELGRVAIEGALRKISCPAAEVDEVIMGVVYQAGMKANPARQSAIAAGIPVESPAVTINQQCASGLRAVEIGAQQIMLGNADVVVAGGMESMSNVPYLVMDGRKGYRMGHSQVYDGLLYDALNCVFCNSHIGLTAEALAEQYGISREEQDRFALASNANYRQADEKSLFSEEIIPVECSGSRGEKLLVEKDEHPNLQTSVEKLAKLRPAFKADGTVTAGNASGINDGGAAVVMMSPKKAREMGLEPLAYYRTSVSVGVDPKVMGIGPVPATLKLLKKAKLSLEDIDLFEYNEAFAAQCLAVNRELGIDPTKINVNGGAIALGHPVGASSIRILIHMIYELRRRSLQRGLVSLCAGGGPGMAMLVETSG